MTDHSFPIVYLPGAGGGAPDLAVFKQNEASIVEPVHYPSSQRHLAGGMTADALIADLIEQIEQKIPYGPIRLVGLSIGGHFGYVCALRLQAKGRQIESFCAIDTFMFGSIEPSAGWKRRALSQAAELVRKGSVTELAAFVRSKFWRLLIRVAGDRVHKMVSGGGAKAAVDPILESELSMRMMLREVAPWMALLDANPVPLHVPSVLLRTRMTAVDDAAWHVRCPAMQIWEVPGHHHNLFDAENVGSLREAYLISTQTHAPAYA